LQRRFAKTGNYLHQKGEEVTAKRYLQAGLTVVNTIFDEPYLSTARSPGLLLHSIYHRPMDGIMFLLEAKFLMANQACGEIIMHAKSRFTCSVSLINETYYTFFNIK
jgi:hypothetical protein